MVQESMEDGGFDTEADGSARATDLCITLPQTISANTSPTERELKRIVTKLLMGASESELICQNLFTDCNGSCIRGLLVKLLVTTYGYNASVCRTKWQKTGKVPGGPAQQNTTPNDATLSQWKSHSICFLLLLCCISCVSCTFNTMKLLLHFLHIAVSLEEPTTTCLGTASDDDVDANSVVAHKSDISKG